MARLKRAPERSCGARPRGVKIPVQSEGSVYVQSRGSACLQSGGSTWVQSSNDRQVLEELNHLHLEICSGEGPEVVEDQGDRNKIRA